MPWQACDCKHNTMFVLGNKTMYTAKCFSPKTPLVHVSELIKFKQRIPQVDHYWWCKLHMEDESLVQEMYA